MKRALSILLSFLLVTLLAVGAVEWFYGTLEESLMGDKKVAQVKPEHTERSTAGKTAAGPTPSPLPKTAARQTEKYYSIITKRSLFGKVEGKKTPQKVPQQQKPAPTPTSLDLVLLGTISGSDNEQRAIIRDKKKGKQDIYYKGDAIKHALIKEIHRGKIILDVIGKEEVLIMEESKSPRESVKNKKNGKPETYSLADVMEEEEKSKKPPRRKAPPKKSTLKLELNPQESKQ